MTKSKCKLAFGQTFAVGAILSPHLQVYVPSLQPLNSDYVKCKPENNQYHCDGIVCC